MTPEQRDTGQLTAAVRQVLPSARAGLERLVRIPSVSADPAAAAHPRARAREGAPLPPDAGPPPGRVATLPGGPAAAAAPAARPPRRPPRSAYCAPPQHPGR